MSCVKGAADLNDTKWKGITRSTRCNRAVRINVATNESASITCAAVIPDEFAAKRSNLPQETKPIFVTSTRNGVARPPYEFKVTREWAVKKSRISRYTVLAAIAAWSCSAFVFIAAYTYVFGSLSHDSMAADDRLSALESTVLQLTQKIQAVESNFADLREQCHSLVIDAQRTNVAPTSSLIRSKRSGSEMYTDPTERPKNKRNRRRSRETIAVQFSGSKPYGFSLVPPEGVLGPWIESTNDVRNVEKFGGKLQNRNSSLEINREGLYMIYAQVTYQTINVSNSYSINVISGADKTRSQPIATCSSFGKLTRDGEISCYTSVVQHLYLGDIVYLQQGQPNREIIFSKTYTYFGIICLV